MPLMKTSALFSGNGMTLHYCAKRLCSVVSRCLVFSFFHSRTVGVSVVKKNATVRGENEKHLSFFL